jgi:hypothetical protein
VRAKKNSDVRAAALLSGDRPRKAERPVSNKKNINGAVIDRVVLALSICGSSRPLRYSQVSSRGHKTM